VEEAHGVGQRVLDEHALRVARDHRGGAPAVVRQEDRRLLVAQVLNEHLAEGMVLHQLHGLFEDAREPVLSGRHLQFDRAPRGPRDERDLLA
jgi:hypothetical protein